MEATVTLNDRALTVLLPASVACALASPAVAGFTRAEARILKSNSVVNSQVKSGTDQQSEAYVDHFGSDPRSKEEVFGLAVGVASHGRSGAIEAIASATSNYSSMHATASCTTEASDVVIRRRDGGGAGSPVLVTAYFKPTGSTELSGAVAPWERPFVSAQYQWSASVVSFGGSTQSIQGSYVENLAGETAGTPLGSRQGLTFEARVGEAFSISLHAALQASTIGGPDTAGGPWHQGTSYASLEFALSAANETPFVEDLTAFVLPEGYTAESADLGIVDNKLTPVPAPGAIALMGLAAAAGRRRRA